MSASPIPPAQRFAIVYHTLIYSTFSQGGFYRNGIIAVFQSVDYEP